MTPLPEQDSVYFSDRTRPSYLGFIALAISLRRIHQERLGSALRSLSTPGFRPEKAYSTSSALL
jgi:hypothetical protein